MHDRQSHARSRALNLTITPDCFQNHEALSFHSGSGDAHSRSKYRKICGTSLPISMIEMFFPIHVRAPYPNCKTAHQSISYTLERGPQRGLHVSKVSRVALTARKLRSIVFRLSASASIHRSGLNSSASLPQTSVLVWITGPDMLTFVPAGRYCPQMVAPPSGTKRSRGKPTPGWSRIASFMVACLNRC